jgi:hypothetical protein
MSTLSSGDTYGSLTVIRFIELRQRGMKRRQVYLFRCVCGTEVELLGTDVYRERIKSCGCTHDCGYEEAAFRAIRIAYISNATRRGLDFALTDTQLKQMFSGDCHYCGEPPSNQSRKRRKSDFASFKYNGIDRIVNEQGYTKSNCVPCCKPCNWMKQRMTTVAFLTHCKRIVEYSNNG